MERVTIAIEGMSCGHCVGAVKRALESVKGVQVEQVSIGRATVSLDPATTTDAQLTEAIEDEGYTVASVSR